MAAGGTEGEAGSVRVDVESLAGVEVDDEEADEEAEDEAEEELTECLGSE